MFDRFFAANDTFGSKAFASESGCACSSSENNTALLLTMDTASAVSIFVVVRVIIISIIGIISHVIIPHNTPLPVMAV